MNGKTRTLIAFAAAASAVAGSAIPASAAAPQHVVNGWTLQNGGVAVISAAGANYAPAGGDLWAQGHFHAHVTCMITYGNDSVVTAHIDSTQDPAYPGGEIVVAEAVAAPNPANDLWRISFGGNGGIYPVENGCWEPLYAPVAVTAGQLSVS